MKNNFIFVTYWWGRGKYNHNTQRPCPTDVKMCMGVAKVLLEYKTMSKQDILQGMIEYGIITESEADEIGNVEESVKLLNKIGGKVVKSNGIYKLLSAKNTIKEGVKDADLLKGLIKKRKNPFTVLGRSKIGLGYHQNAKNNKLCSYKNCYQFPLTFEQMIVKWSGKLTKLGIKNYAEEYKTAPIDYPKSKSIKGSYDFRTSQEGMNFKGEFILKMINKYKKPVVYLDGDMLVHKYPTLFDSQDFDFMLRHWAFDPLDFLNKKSFSPKRFETSGGIMYFNNTTRSKQVLNGWIKLNNQIKKAGKPGADDRILTMYLHKFNKLYSCKWLPIPSTYLWLTDKYSTSTFHGKTLPKNLHVVIDHPNCLTTEEMAKNQGAIMNKSGSRYPLNYFKYVKGNSLSYPFNNTLNAINIKNTKFKERLNKLLLEHINGNIIPPKDFNKTDIIINKKSNSIRFMNTLKSKLIQIYYKGILKPKPFLLWLDSKPYTWMSTRIEIK